MGRIMGISLGARWIEALEKQLNSHIARSSNGRTAAFEAVDPGSSPGWAAISLKLQCPILLTHSSKVLPDRFPLS